MPQRFSDREIRDALPAAARDLAQRRADLIGDDLIEHFVARDWMEWRGGALKLTQVGLNVIAQATAAQARG
ncbi:hypothetical protein [Methylibium rhizosphaerae]|jgi:hypothetical protein|uniref:hypothetical protein n=1 Tax=Methylibium rhizosphaerae TaxID=2570323 RepID=UPI00112D769A|nr:hypothetical protein [Methylibium rhizosphaerae]